MKNIVSISKLSFLLILAAYVAMPTAVFAHNRGENYMYDRNVATQVKLVLNADPQLRQYDLDVVTLRDGVVRLSGNVMWAADKDRAALDALQVDGVTKLSNTIGIENVTDDFVGG